MKWNFGKEQKLVFEKLKKEFREDKVIIIYNLEKLGVMEIDILDIAIGVVYSQPDENRKLRPIAFFSKKFLPVELNYEIYNKELLAIIKVIKEWRYYLENAKY